MDAEDVISLFDSWWFNQNFFKKNSETPTPSSLQTNPDLQIEEKSPQTGIFPSQLTIYTRSKSEEAMSPKISMNFGSFSPNSVLPAPHLETVLSGIEAEADGFVGRTPQTAGAKSKTEEKKKKEKRKKMMKSFSKSLSELEFEELKGFMDLGFIFSEEDKRDSTLVEIIPGLQRLGQGKNGDFEVQKMSGSSSSAHQEQPSRPYLSEAWEILDKRKKEKENPLVNWKFPSVNNEIGMKDSLKWWAHTVASTVR